MTLADRLGSRDNAVTLVRLGLAALVVFGHAYEVGGYGADPARRTAGVTCGEIGVNAFFAVSGFLVLQSWLRSRSALGYLGKRALRIFPGFWTCLAATGLGLFPFLWARQHGVAWSRAWDKAPFVGYVVRNALLRVRQSEIGGLFADQPSSGVVNGALWSLFPEFLCYLGVAAAGLGGCFAPKRRWIVPFAALGIFAIHVGGAAWVPRLQGRAHDSAWYLWRVSTQAAFFAMGAAACLHAGKIRIGAGRVLLGAALLAAIARAGGYAWAAPFLLTGIVLQLSALLPGAWLERLGDYSYGLYVYHFPLQQTLLYFHLRPAHAGSFFALSLALTLPVAAASWHWIEQPALDLKSRLNRA